MGTQTVRVRRRRLSPVSFLAGTVVGIGVGAGAVLLALRQAAEDDPSSA